MLDTRSAGAACQPAAEIPRLLDALANLIQQVEAACARGTPAQMHEQVRVHAPVTRQLMDSLGAAIAAFLADDPPAEEHAQMYALVTSRLRGWSSTSPLFHHIFNTPRNKLGPYEVYDLLLDGHAGGADVAGLMMDFYYMNMTTSAAFRLRQKLLVQRLGAEIRRRSASGAAHRPVRLLNLHTANGRELHELIQDRSLRAAVQVTCMDTDAAALRRVKQQLVPQLAGRVSFRFGDLRDLIAARRWPDAPYDVIYALMLSDQLSDDHFEALIAGCYRGLRPQEAQGRPCGVLLFGNFADSMSPGEHALINWVLELNLRRRSAESLRQIFGRTPFGAQAVSCELDALRASWLVAAERA